MAVYWPTLDLTVTEEAGTRGGTHYGIDLAADLGDPVIAPFDGVAVYVGGDGASGRLWLGSFWLYPNGEGKTVDIQRADGLISRVGHLDGYAIKQGDRVKAGQTVGYAGTTGYSTGVHVHWELRWDRAWSGGNWINPRSLKPRIYTPKTTNPKERTISMSSYTPKTPVKIPAGQQVRLPISAKTLNAVGQNQEGILAGLVNVKGKPGTVLDLQVCAVQYTAAGKITRIKALRSVQAEITERGWAKQQIVAAFKTGKRERIQLAVARATADVQVTYTATDRLI